MGFLDNLFNKSSTIQSIGPEEAKNNLEKNKSIFLLDVREPNEFKSGHIKGAKNLSVSIVDPAITNFVGDKNATIYVYCQSGMRSRRACDTLIKMGYTNVYNLGGIMNWPYEIVRN